MAGGPTDWGIGVIRLLTMVTVPLSARAFLRGQLHYLKQRGYEVHLAAAPTPKDELMAVAEREGAEAHFLPLVRDIALVQDLKALVAACRLMRQVRPQITNVGTPKAGLIGGLASVLTGVPARVYTLHGLRFETSRGARRLLLTAMERVACACAHRVVCVSPSLRDQVVRYRLAPVHKLIVLGAGSTNGLEAERFLPQSAVLQEADHLRQSMGLPSGVPTIGFVGRFVRDKGLAELLEAFKHLRASDPRTHLLLVGDYEQGDPVDAEVRRAIDTCPGVIKAGFVADTALYYHLMDVVALPTYREGLGTTALEAAAAGKPVVTTTATGAVDAVVHGVTGLTVPVGQASALADALQQILQNQEFARALGQAGQQRVLREFKPQRIWTALDALYKAMLLESKRRKGERLKRTIDLVGSGLGLVLLAIPLTIVATAVRLALGGPILFRQQRPGLHGRPFMMVKFRTMRNATDAQGNPLPDSQRLTPLGRFLRASSLDELPELFNVLRGDMSLVGPRPLLMQYVDRYTPEQARRHEVRPGMTGWAQVNGRNAISWEEKFKLDVWYVDNRSLLLDLKIIWMTLFKVFKREGISAAGEATMPVFMGSQHGEA